jgi:hypothetical protein
MGIVNSISLSHSARPLSPSSPTLVSTDSISEQKSQGETAKAATDAKAAPSPAGGAEARPVPPRFSAAAAPDRQPAIPDRGPLMMTAIPGGGASALPGPLGEKRFAGEMEGDFATALAMVEPGGPAGQRRSHRSIWGSLVRLLRLDGLRGPATRADRHVAFDGFRNPMHDEKIERDRRYGTVYSVVEYANAYLVGIEMPRRIPASSLKELWKLPDEMPDYDYTVTLHERVLAVRAGVRGDAMRRLSYISASFPSDFLTRIEFDQPVTSFKHCLLDKVLEIVVFKAAGSETVSRVA